MSNAAEYRSWTCLGQCSHFTHVFTCFILDVSHTVPLNTHCCLSRPKLQIPNLAPNLACQVEIESTIKTLISSLHRPHSFRVRQQCTHTNVLNLPSSCRAMMSHSVSGGWCHQPGTECGTQFVAKCYKTLYNVERAAAEGRMSHST